MTPFRRWTAVVVGTLVITADADRAEPAARRRERRHRRPAARRWPATARTTPWSGFVETDGMVQLPDADRFSDVGALFGERTSMRAWWQDADHWRVDQLLLSGEDDLVHRDGTTLRWEYEDLQATVSRDPEIRLPRTADLVPPVLAERLLRGAGADDVRRIGAERVAGVSAPGLRVTPSSDLSSIDHADLWLDPESGVPLRVEVYAAGSSSAGLRLALRRLLLRAPRRRRRGLRPAGRRRRRLRRRAGHRRRRQPVRARPSARDRGRSGQGGVVGPRGRRLRRGG